jgi:hypothetical protein
MKQKKSRVRSLNKITTAKINNQVSRLGYFAGVIIPDGDNRLTLEKRLQMMLECTMKDDADPVLVKMLAKQITKALDGDRAALELLLDRAYGKSVQRTIEVGTPEVRVEHNVINIDSIQDQDSGKV